MADDNVPVVPSPFARPPSTVPPPSPAPPLAPNLIPSKPRRNDWHIVKYALIGLAVLTSVGFMSVIGRGIARHAAPTAGPVASTPVSAPPTQVVQDGGPRKWAIRFNSFKEIGDVTLPMVPAGFVRGFPSSEACEAAIRPSLTRWGSLEAAKIPGSEWGWHAGANNERDTSMAFVSDGDQRVTWRRGWCVEE